MNKENKVVNNIVWGISAIVGFLIADRIYDTTVKMINKPDYIDMEEIEKIESE